MRKTNTLLAVGLVLGLWANQAWSASQEPIQPIAPAVIKEPAKVELGKKLALQIAPALTGDAAALAEQDPSTRALIERYLDLRR